MIPDNLKERVENVKKIYSELDLKHKSLMSSIKSYSTNIDAHVIKITDGQSASAIVESWVRDLTSAGISQIENLVNNGLEYIFDDRSLKFKIEVPQNSREVYFKITDEETGVKTNLDENGGGLIVVVSFLINIAFLFIHDCRKFMLLDEALTQISDAYIENMFRFISSLIERFGLDILIVSHDLRIKAYASRIYAVSHGGNVKLIKDKTGDIQ